MADIENLNALLKNLDAEARIIAAAGWQDDGVADQAKAVRALLAENERLREDVKDHAAARAHYCGKVGEIAGERDQLKAENERLRQAAKLDAADLAWSESDSREQSAEIGQLKAELERARADADRFAWLCTNAVGHPLVGLYGDELAAEIDAAMGKGGDANG